MLMVVVAAFWGVVLAAAGRGPARLRAGGGGGGRGTSGQSPVPRATGTPLLFPLGFGYFFFIKKSDCRL